MLSNRQPGTHHAFSLRPWHTVSCMSAALIALAATMSGCATAEPKPPIPALSATATRSVPTKVGRLAVHDTQQSVHQSADPQTKRTLVLWPSVLSDASLYQAQVDALRSKYRIVVVDGPGHGGSGEAPGPFSMADCAAALAQVLDALGIKEPVVVGGTSWGGLVSGEFAIAYPNRTAGLVMMNTPVFASDRGFGDHFVSVSSRWTPGSWLFSSGVMRAFFLPATRNAGGPALVRFEQHLQRANGAAMGPAVRSVLLDREALAPRMANIAAPTLVIAGAQDGMYPLASLREAARALPRGRFEVVESSHIAVIDAPNATTALIEQFVDGLKP